MNPLPTTMVVAFVVAFGTVVLGCGHEKPAPPKEPEQAQRRSAGPSMQMHAELGVLDEQQVRQTFEKVWRGPMTDCQKKSNEFVSGKTTLKMRVNHQGHVKWAYFADSELGDQSAQACMLEAIRAVKWPIPQGGEDGLVEQQLPFADYADRPAVPWEPERVSEVLEKARDDIQSCLSGSSGAFTVTLIVDRRGAAMSAGVAQPDENSDKAANCLAELFKDLTYPRPGSWPAKVSFQVP